MDLLSKCTERLVLACSSPVPMHEAQLLTYLKLTGIQLGLLINFNVPLLRDGISRLINGEAGNQ